MANVQHSNLTTEVSPRVKVAFHDLGETLHKTHAISEMK